MFGVSGAGPLVDLPPRPAELVHPTVAPDPDRVIQRPMAGAVLLCDQHDGELLEPQRHVEPPETETVVVRRPAGGLALADRADAPRPVAAADPDVRRDVGVGAVDVQRPAPCAELGETPRVDDRAATLAHLVTFLVDRGERPFP